MCDFRFDVNPIPVGIFTLHPLNPLIVYPHNALESYRSLFPGLGVPDEIVGLAKIAGLVDQSDRIDALAALKSLKINNFQQKKESRLTSNQFDIQMVSEGKAFGRIKNQTY